MPSPKDIYIHCDELANIPKVNLENWLYELEILVQKLPNAARVLQVGCGDGSRLIALHTERPDLVLTGLDIDEGMLSLAQKKLDQAGKKIPLIREDITKGMDLVEFDYVICLNNTLGYIPEDEKAIQKMKKIGKKVIISVFGEKFTDERGREYFESIKAEVSKIEGNTFHLRDFCLVKRYTKEKVEKWNGEIIETPLGYFCILQF